MEHIELPHNSELPPPLLPPASEITWLPRRRRHTPRSQRAPWSDPRITTIIQRQMATGFALVQQSTVQQITSGTTGTFSITATAGNCLVLACGTALNSGVAVAATASDTQNAWTLGAAVNNAATGGGRAHWWYANNCVGGTYTITVSLGAAVKANWEVYEWSGVGSIAGNRTIVDTTSGGAGSASSFSFALTPQQSASLALMMVMDGGTASTWTKDGTSTSLSQTTTNIDFASSYRVLGSTSVAAVAPSFSTGSAVQLAATSIVLRPAGTQTVTSVGGQTFATATSWTTGSFTTKLGAVYLLILETGGQASQPIATVVDSVSETWGIAGRQNNGSGGELSAWLLNGTNFTSRTITVTGSGGSTTLSLRILELTGVIPNASLVDQVQIGTGNGTSVSLTTGATTIPGETAILIVGTAGAFGTSTQGGSDSLAQNQNSGSGSYLVSTRILSSVGTVNMTATLGTSSQWSAILITLKTGAEPFVQSSFTSSASLGAGTHGTFVSSIFNVAPGDSLVAAFQTGANQTVTAITDNQGNTWTKVEGTAGGANGQSTLWAASSVIGGKLSLNVTNAGTTGPLGVIFYQFSGALTFDVGTTNTGNSQTASTGTTTTPNYLSEVVVAVAGDIGTGRVYTAATPFATPNSMSTNVNLLASFATMFSPGAVPSAQSTTFAIPGGSNVNWSSAIATFKIAASPTYYNHTVAETLTATETWTRHSTFGRAVSETLTATEAWTRRSTFGRQVSETLTATEAWTRVSTFGRRVTETLTAAETWSRHSTFGRTVTETLTASEVWTRLSHFGRRGTETLTLAETWSMGGVFTHTPSLTVTLTRTVDCTASIGKTVNVSVRLDN